MPALPERVRMGELMDDPALDPREHIRALRALERLNRLSRSAAMLWPHINSLARANPGRVLRLLDVATGAGDVPIALARRAARRGLRLEIIACDISPRALEHAAAAARRTLGPDHPIRLVHCEATRAELPARCDIVACSLFLHHLDDPDAIAVLRRMGAAAERLVLVNDLRRSAPALGLAWAASRAFSRSRVVREDAVLSVRAAFTTAEALELARRAGLAGATIARRWPLRFLLVWRRP